MAVPVILPNFNAGELSPALAGRTTLAKYQNGVAVGRNFFVDYRGGLSTRTGFSHLLRCRLEADNPRPRLLPFIFNSEQAYGLELNGGKMRVIYRGGYVLEGAFAASAVSASGAGLVVTIPGHNFVASDFVNLGGFGGLLRANGVSGINGRTLIVLSVAGNQVTFGDYVSNGAYAPINAAGWTAWSGGGVAARVYEISTPWNGDVLYSLNYSQRADIMTVTSVDFPAYDIRRLGHANWQIVQETYGSSLASPTGFGAYPQNTGDAATQVFFFAYAVSAIDADGRESAIVVATCENKALDQTMTPVRSNNLQWDVVPGAYKYRVYKAQPVPSGLQGGGPYFFGVIGNVYENRFNDANYTVDFTVGPPVLRNPFLDNGAASVAIVSGGQNYLAPFAVITDSTGSGMQIALTSDTGVGASPYGEIVSASVVTKGTNYTAPSVSIGDAAPAGSGFALAFNGAWVANPLGTGFVPAPGSITIANGGVNYHGGSYTFFAEARAATNPVGSNRVNINVTQVVNGVITAISWVNSDITPSPSTGISSTGTGDTLNFVYDADTVVGTGAVVTVALGGTTNPNCSAYLQQRRVFGGSRDNPTTLWLSQPGQFTNFNTSETTRDSDAITAGLDANEVNIITDMIAATGGLVVLTSGGAFLVSGDSGGVTPTSIQAQPQAFTGSQSDLRALRIANQLLYAGARGASVNELAYNFYTSQFSAQDISVLSAHLLEGHKIVQWCYAAEPFKLVWAVRDDGVLLSLAYLKEQDVYGWTRHDTVGEFISIISIPEGREDAVYAVVNRYTPELGSIYAVERLNLRTFGADPAAGVPAQPERAVCVDGAITYGTFAPNADIVQGYVTTKGYVYSATIDYGGASYTAPHVIIEDLTGSGAEIDVGLTDGVITSITLINPGSNYSAPRITVEDSTGSGAVISVRIVDGMLFQLSASIFSDANIGQTIRVRGGKGKVISVPATSQLLCDMERYPAPMPNLPTQVCPRVPQGSWTLSGDYYSVGNLEHLEGATVQVVVDGSVQTPKVVENGCVTLDYQGSLVIIGQGFTAQMQTMRLEQGQETMQGAAKTFPTIVLRGKDARGLMVGSTWESMVQVKQRDDNWTGMGEAIPFQRGGDPLEPVYEGAPMAYVPLYYEDSLTHSPSDWRDDGQICIQQAWPLPATVLAIVPFMLKENLR